MLFAVVGIALASGSVFPVSGWFSGLASVVILAFFFLIASVGGDLGSIRKTLIVLGLTSAAGMCLIAGDPAPRLALLAWVFICAFWVERSSGGKCRGSGGEVMVLGLASLGWAGLLMLHSRSTVLWFALRRIRVCVSIAPVLAPVTPVRLIGIWFLGFFSVSIVVVLVGKYVIPLVLASMWSRRASAFLTILLGLTVALTVPYVGCELRSGKRAGCGRSRPTGSFCRFSAALYSPGLLDWEVPSPERLGLVRSGMFGLFRRSLERYMSMRGGAVAETDSLTPEVLSRVGLMVFINPTRGLSRPEQEALSRFVVCGGSLLALGDHTDIGGSRMPLNDILQCTSIRFNFDSAICLRERWRTCLRLRKHPVTQGLRDEVDAQIGIGASLEIAPPAFPLVTGRHAFGDVGDYENSGRGAYMGNCRQDHDEALCEIVLVAGEEVGNGRVLVFGDTSPFQNGAHFLSQRFIANAIHWLCGDEITLGNGIAPDIRPFDTLAAVDFSLNPNVARSLFTVNSLGGLANCFYRAAITPVPLCDWKDWLDGPPGDTAAFMVLIAPTRSLGHDEVLRLKRYMRSGGRLIMSKGYTKPEPCAMLLAELGLVIEPVPLGNGEASGHLRHKDAWAIACTRPPSAAPNPNVEHRASTVPRAASSQPPPAPPGADTLVHPNAPLPAGTLLHAQAFGYPTVVTRPVGHGSFTLISDGRFLLDGNLEGEIAATPENVAFVLRLIDNLRKGKRDLTRKDRFLVGRHPH
jgi:hypothetical protein